jgi:large conductance mechanosensitive channel
VKGVIDPVVGIVKGQAGPDALINGLGSLGSGVVNFLLLAAIVFFVFVKPMNKLKALQAAKAAPAPAPGPTQEQLLAEIRDLLKK